MYTRNEKHNSSVSDSRFEIVKLEERVAPGSGWWTG